MVYISLAIKIKFLLLVGRFKNILVVIMRK